jgi:predicted O-linked N-acetylglucosamine transferase (SPINDLY family)
MDPQNLDTQSQFADALNFHRAGQLEKAKESYKNLISIWPYHAESLQNLGILYAQDKDFAQAADYFKKATEADPANANYFSNLGTALNDLGRPELSIEFFEKAILINPNSPDACYNLGNVLQKLGQYEKSIEYYKKTIAFNPAWLEAYLNCGNSYDMLGDFNSALSFYNSIIQINPYFTAAYVNRGNVLLKLNQKEQALESFEIVKRLGLDSFQAHLASAEILQSRGDYRQAIEACHNAIRISPYDARAYYVLGMNYFNIRELNQAIENFKHAINLKPDYAEAYNGVAVCFVKALHFDQAKINFTKALELDPNLVIARINLADAYYAAGDIVSALAHFQKLPADMQPVGLMQFFKQRLADWSNYQADFDNFIDRLNKPRFLNSMEDPWHMQRITDSPELAKMVAENFVKASGVVVQENKTPAVREKNKKIKIAYFSSDFREHAVTHLALGLFNLHSRDKFEVYAFAFGKNDAHPELREKIEKSFDHFININSKNDIDAAQLARDLNIDIAFDLSGITNEARPAIFLNRAAPIQINFLGYTGTLGTKHHDYIIGDPVVIPLESREHYSEKVIHIPCMMPFDTSHDLSKLKFTRAEVKLPPEGFIFCSFNQCFKITPETFDSWMRILKRVPGSCLWISQPYESLAITNLKKEAELRGVDPARIIFADRVRGVDTHLARIALSDLFLDTFPYNAHTSAIDTLWAGVPIVTRMGRSFASRLAGSLLKSVGLDDLIANSVQEFEDLSVDLAMHPEKLKKYRKLLEKNRTTHRLFNTKLYVENFEKALIEIYNKQQAGLPPDHVVIE